MQTLLHIRTSLFSEDGESSRLADQYVHRWRAANPAGQVILRDLAVEPVPHLSAERFTAFTTPAATRTAEQAEHAAYSDALIAEIAAADEVVLGLPMYNFGIPSVLKAYFDHIARSGITFRYTAEGPEGLLQGKRVLVFAARGGSYAGSPLDTQTDYVRNFLGFLGMADVTFIYAEGLALGDESRRQALDSAQETVRTLPLTAISNEATA